MSFVYVCCYLKKKLIDRFLEKDEEEYTGSSTPIKVHYQLIIVALNVTISFLSGNNGRVPFPPLYLSINRHSTFVWVS